jgi:hypothetical protein
MHDMERIAGAVIAQAVVDAGLRGPTAEEHHTTPAFARAEARSFLTASAGEWRRARDWWCAIAGRDSETLRRWALRKLGLPLDPPPVSSEPLRLFHLVPKPQKPRPEAKGPKMLALQELMKRPEGISPEEVMEHFGWAKSTVMGVLTSDMRKYGVTGRRGMDGRYRLVEIA